tara:strand:+ start:1536 stop:1883 length:348 start_codon:yes stop_codon:yes gene_type:complete
MDFQSLDKKVESNMDLIVDMFDGSLNFDDKIDSDKNEQYYIGKAENIIKQLDKSNYYIFLIAMLKDYNTLDEVQKDKIIELLNIKPIIVEKIIEKRVGIKVDKNKKPKINNYDDY